MLIVNDRCENRVKSLDETLGVLIATSKDMSPIKFPFEQLNFDRRIFDTNESHC
jgi:hypothetical protein